MSKGKPKVKGFTVTSKSGRATLRVRNVYSDKQAVKLGTELAALGTMLLRDFGKFAGRNVVVKEIEVSEDGVTVRNLNPRTESSVSNIVEEMLNNLECSCGEKH